MFDGTVHDRLICDEGTDVAVRPVGGFGRMLLGGADELVGLACCSDEGVLVPLAFTAEILYM